jgi:phosphopentomutase
MTMRSIQTKLKENDAMITTADKGNSTVILPTQQYNSKIKDFIYKNKFQTSTKTPQNLFRTKLEKPLITALPSS